MGKIFFMKIEQIKIENRNDKIHVNWLFDK